MGSRFSLSLAPVVVRKQQRQAFGRGLDFDNYVDHSGLWDMEIEVLLMPLLAVSQGALFFN